VKSNELHIRRVGLRLGLALEALRGARLGLDVVRSIADLLPEKMRENARRLCEEVGELETELWSFESREAVGEPRKAKR
jgi:hypothetical protein